MATESESNSICAYPQDQGGAEGAVRSGATEHSRDPSDQSASAANPDLPAPSTSSGPPVSEPEKDAASRDGRAEAAGLTTSMVHAPLHKLWELERLEMARQREEMRSFRGELRSLKPGEHTTFREEQTAKQELQTAMRELILAAGPDDRSTLEALLRAVEAGHEDSVSSPVVRHFLSASRRRAQAAAQPETQRPRSFLEAPAARVAALLLTVVALGALRRMRLAARLRRALAALAGRWRNLWGQHLADTPAGSVMRRLHSRSIPPQPLYAQAPSLDGFNAMAQGSKRSLWRPQTWFAPGHSDPVAEAAAAAAAGGLSSTPEAALGAAVPVHHSMVAPLVASGPSDLNFYQVYPVAEAATPWRPRGGIDPPSVGSRSFPTLSSALLTSRQGSGGAAVDLCSIPRAGIVQQQQQPVASPRSGEAGQHEEQQGYCLSPTKAPPQVARSSSASGSPVRWSVDHGSGVSRSSSSSTGSLLLPGNHGPQASFPVLKADLLTAGAMDDLRAPLIRHSRSSTFPATELSRSVDLPDEATASLEDTREDPERRSGQRGEAADEAHVAEGAVNRVWPERDNAEGSEAAKSEEEETEAVGSQEGVESEGDEAETASPKGPESTRSPSRPHRQPPSLPRRPCEALVA